MLARTLQVHAARRAVCAAAARPAMRTPSLLYARLYTAPSDPAHRQHQHQHHQQQQQREPEHEHAHHDHLFGGKLDDLHTPFPKDVPPISQRLRPLVPFLIVWTIITSLAVHLLRVRTEGEQSTARAHAQESVLEGLVQRFQAGEVVDDTEIRRELEMVGLRERTSLTLGVDADLAEMREVSWWEVLRGRKRDGEDEEGGDGKKEEDMSDEEKETAAAKEWSKIVEQATAEPAKPPPMEQPTRPAGVAKRAESANVYL